MNDELKSMYRWYLRPYSGKKPCMYCGHPAKLRWYRAEVTKAGRARAVKSTPHLSCKACASALGFVPEAFVDWEQVRVRDETDIVREEVRDHGLQS